VTGRAGIHSGRVHRWRKCRRRVRSNGPIVVPTGRRRPRPLIGFGSKRGRSDDREPRTWFIQIGRGGRNERLHRPSWPPYVRFVGTIITYRPGPSVPWEFRRVRYRPTGSTGTDRLPSAPWLGVGGKRTNAKVTTRLGTRASSIRPTLARKTCTKTIMFLIARVADVR